MTNRDRIRTASGLMGLVLIGLSIALGTSVVIQFFVVGLAFSASMIGALTIALLLTVPGLALILGPGVYEASLTGIRLKALGDSLDRTSASIKELSKDVDALGRFAVLEQVSTMNRLLIQTPELAKLWTGIEGLSVGKTREIFYIYTFLDIFELLMQLKKGEPLGTEFIRLWTEIWIPELLKSDAGQIMLKAGLLRYYSEETKKKLGIAR